MATNFPVSLDTYTTKIDNVDDVLASHVNSLQGAVVQLETKLGITNSSVSATVDYFLKHASGSYRTHVHDATSDDGAKIPMTSLADVTIASLLNQQYLRYNSGTGKWENYTLSVALSGLSDVTITGAATRQGLYYNGSGWQNGYANAVYA